MYLTEYAPLPCGRYDVGGHYGRHIDEGGRGTSRQLKRSISFLIYLTPDDWSAADGGALRVFPPTGANGNARAGASGSEQDGSVDIQPAAGSLVVFDSATVPHMVLPTHRERVAIVGWLLEPR